MRRITAMRSCRDTPIVSTASSPERVRSGPSQVSAVNTKPVASFHAMKRGTSANANRAPNPLASQLRNRPAADVVGARDLAECFLFGVDALDCFAPLMRRERRLPAELDAV